ncbi:helix-turn-helix domain-containing protein [Staphylococcus caledonicus]|uniref:helix-turn-helix domain-containing protein n=1 Tax=Staphylococcus caledonicus TaxID=2741333 RepID=UPI0018E4AE8D|nr:helix-turn-helix domain-containing protein [Staphylococcus caledonicus]
MRTIGETLKGRRERLGMTLAELEERTQIKRATLKKIEENRFNELAKVDYAEGFIRRYASVVNMNVEQLINVHGEEIPNSQNQLDTLLTRYQNDDAPTYRTKNKEPLQLVVLIGGIIVITFILWLLAMLIL